MTVTRHDVLVLGAGNAGQAAARVARAAGRTVAIIEPGPVGGTCPNRGCVPKKVLVAAAEAFEQVLRAKVHGVAASAPRLDWSALMARKRTIVEPLAKRMEEGLAEQGIELVRGHARFTGRRELVVGDRRLSGQRIVIAVGSRPRTLRFPGAELLRTSADLLELDDPGSAVVFVGAGVVGMEFAHVLVRAGVTVTMIEPNERPLADLDPDCVDLLTRHSRELGIAIETGAEVESVAPRNGGFQVVFRRAGQRLERTVDHVFNTAGRVPALDDLALDQAGIPFEDGKVDVDDHLRSRANPDVWFAGDARPGAPQLSPVASAEGRIAGHNLLHDEPRAPDYLHVPGCVYTVPHLARVGRTEAAAAAAGLAVEVHGEDMEDWISTRTQAEPVAYAKVLVDPASRRIAGAHLLGHGASEVIHVFALAMKHGITADDLGSFLYAFPTFTSDMKSLF